MLNVKKAPTLRASLRRILILIYANKIDLAHNFSVDFFQQLYYKYEKRLFTSVNMQIFFENLILFWHQGSKKPLQNANIVKLRPIVPN